MAHPRKFVEKIAIHNQRQQEETRAFEEIMKEVATIGNSMKGPQQQYRSLPNVNLNIAQNHVDLQKALNSLGEMQRHGIGDRSPMRERRFTGNRPMPFPKRNFAGVDPSPYHVAPPYLSPPQLDQGAQGWRRAISDSSLHQTVIAGGHHHHHQPKEIDINKMANEPKRAHSPHGRPRSCEVPNIGVYPTSDPGSPMGGTLQNVGSTGSLPDLTNLHIPSPLQTPIDTEENQMQATSPPLYPGATRQGHIRRHTHSPTMDKHMFPPQMQMETNLSPLEMRLQQVQLYQQSNQNNDLHNLYGSQITTSSQQNMSPTQSTTMSPLFKNFSPAPLSPLEVNMKQHQQPNSSPLPQQHQDQFAMHFPGASVTSPRMQYPTMSNQPQNSGGFPSFLQYYMQSGGRVPDLIVTEAAEDPQKFDFARDISSAMANMAGGDTGDLYNTDDPLRVELGPLDMESLQMLSGGDTEVDQATEDQFRMDRLAGSYGFP